ncbi:two pore potassium channel c [Typha angustifolia]|uniref:two pore potassium channel c n=1 Tax=Typha angustifolia TaxID=59011 RepID=UPI003C2F14E1
MDKEPLLSSSSPPPPPPPLPISIRKLLHNSSSTPLSPLCTLPEDGEVSIPPFSPSSSSLSPAAAVFKERLIFGPTDLESFSLLPSTTPTPPSPPPPPLPTIQEASSISIPFYDDSLLWPASPTSSSSSLSTKPKSNLHRSRTAPAMAGINSASNPHASSAPPPAPRRPSVVRNAVIFLFAYLAFGVVVYAAEPSNFTAATTNPIVDALYFCIVTMCTIGYGDITPATPLAKIFSITFVLIGFGFVDILLSAMVSYVLDLQESLLLTAVSKNGGKRGGRHRGDIARHYIVDVKKGRMRIRMKVALALGVVVLCVGVGAFVLRFVERLGWLDAFYLSVMSVTTVGYGDRAFKTLPGRLFAAVWLLLSTLAVARSFLYLAEARIDKRHRMIAKWVLCRDMTVSEFLAADIDNNGFVTKSEFVIYKLKEMGKVPEKDILQICEQFDRLDSGKCGKITLSDLIGSHH